ncbi:MAG: 3'-5' exonuclease [Ichthyobacteriaceae bacterium]|nr:3'-5' exonuclease [Ichthyobacteriaceae bacterium]
MKTFTAIDFETATGSRNSACSVGIITVEDGQITNEYHTLIQPPHNEYNWHNTQVHGITSHNTLKAPTFAQVYAEIKNLLQNRLVVAHNESFDRSVLTKTMALYGLNYSELNLNDKWECTYKIHGKKLNVCAEKFGIELKHHDALSDARACALLYLKKDLSAV